MVGDKNPVVIELSSIFLIIGLYFVLMAFTDTNGLNFLNYCISALLFISLGTVALFFRNPQNLNNINRGRLKSKKEKVWERIRQK